MINPVICLFCKVPKELLRANYFASEKYLEKKSGLLVADRSILKTGKSLFTSPSLRWP